MRCVSVTSSKGESIMKASNRSSLYRASGIALLAGAVMFFGTSDAWAEGNQNPGVFPTRSTPHGMTYRKWAAEWSEWIFSIPTDQSPFFDPDGRFCHVNQAGSVFFLGSNFGGTTERHCVVRPGQSILFSPAGVTGILHLDANTVDELRAGVVGVLAPFNVSADIDGVPLRNMQQYSFVSPLHDLTLPPDNVLGLPPGDYEAIDAGYFLMHAPFTKGRHVIHFHAEAAAYDFVSDVTYVIDVGPEH
jgi:hypothetical protein